VLCAIHVDVRKTNHALAKIGRHVAYHWRAETLQRPGRIRILTAWQRKKHHAVRVVRAIQSASDPVSIGRSLAAARGWTGGQWSALYALWSRESGWDPTAMNSSSGACGIPQFVPCRDWGDTRAQIRDGLAYIEGRYGSPSAALAHSDAYGWY
jgi:hypothetical protein